MYYNGFIKVAAACSTTRLGDSMFNVKEMLNVLKKPTRRIRLLFVFLNYV